LLPPNLIKKPKTILKIQKKEKLAFKNDFTATKSPKYGNLKKLFHLLIFGIKRVNLFSAKPKQTFAYIPNMER